MIYACPVCGDLHEAVPTDPDSFWCGIAFRVCLAIPETCVYVDREFDRGPRGELLVIAPELT